METAKIGEDPQRDCKLSTVPSTFNKYKQKCGASEKRDGNARF
jgi:hypothetical protein